MIVANGTHAFVLFRTAVKRALLYRWCAVLLPSVPMPHTAKYYGASLQSYALLVAVSMWIADMHKYAQLQTDRVFSREPWMWEAAKPGILLGFLICSLVD